MRNSWKPPEAAAFASISSGGGRLVLPADSPYARELALEHAERSARLHGRARLDIGRYTWLMHVDERGRVVMCGSRQAAGHRPHVGGPPPSSPSVCPQVKVRSTIRQPPAVRDRRSR